MTKIEKLLQKALNSPTNLSFNELCKLAEYHGFAFARQSGSHRIYVHEKNGDLMNFQPDKHDKGKAKIKQIDQLIRYLEDHNLIKAD
jgi:predicted RNA binding protein YcfA (HicA-like mRNA interferase family)